MASSALKVTLEFKDLGGGWSESFYLSPPGGNNLKAVVDGLVNNRITVLGSGCSIVRGRVGMTDQPRKVINFRYAKDGRAADVSGNAQGTVRRADQRDTCLLMPYRTAAGTLRYVTLGGFPDAWIDRANEAELMTLTDVGVDSVNPFYDYLIKPPFALNIRERLRTGGNAAKVVTNITKHTDGKYLIQTDGNHGFVSGDKVVLTGLKGVNLAFAHGTRKVADSVDATHFTIDRGPRADLPDVDLTVNAQVAKVGYSYETALSTPENYGLSTRRRGRGFAQRRGRRSASK